MNMQQRIIYDKIIKAEGEGEILDLEQFGFYKRVFSDWNVQKERNPYGEIVDTLDNFREASLFLRRTGLGEDFVEDVENLMDLAYVFNFTDLEYWVAVDMIDTQAA